MSEQIYNQIDKCNSSISHYDMAAILHKVFKDKYRYLGNHKWEYYDFILQEWKPDVRSEKMALDIKTVISDLFSARALHWHNESLRSKSDMDKAMYADFLYEKLINASVKLKNTNFILILIREAGSLFDIRNNDD